MKLSVFLLTGIGTFTLSLRLSLFCEQECTKIILLCNVQIWNFQTINMKFNNNIKLK
jgi:hypothetical protein